MIYIAHNSKGQQCEERQTRRYEIITVCRIVLAYTTLESFKKQTKHQQICACRKQVLPATAIAFLSFQQVPQGY